MKITRNIFRQKVVQSHRLSRRFESTSHCLLWKCILWWNQLKHNGICLMLLCYLKRMNILLFEKYSLSSNFSKTKVVKILRQVKTSVSALLCSIFFYYNNNLDLKSKRFCFHYKSTIKLDEKLYANPASCDKAIINSAKKKHMREMFKIHVVKV